MPRMKRKKRKQTTPTIVSVVGRKRGPKPAFACGRELRSINLSVETWDRLREKAGTESYTYTIESELQRLWAIDVASDLLISEGF